MFLNDLKSIHSYGVNPKGTSGSGMRSCFPLAPAQGPLRGPQRSDRAPPPTPLPFYTDVSINTCASPWHGSRPLVPLEAPLPDHILPSTPPCLFPRDPGPLSPPPICPHGHRGGQPCRSWLHPRGGPWECSSSRDSHPPTPQPIHGKEQPSNSLSVTALSQTRMAVDTPAVVSLTHSPAQGL